MKTYYITILLVGLFTYLAQGYDYKVDNYDNQKNEVLHSNRTKYYFIIATCILIFVSGFRYYVGADFGAYYWNGARYASQLFDSIKSLDEPGTKLIYWFVGLFTTKNFVPILVFALITIGLSLYVIYKNTDCLLMSTLLFVFMGCWHTSFNAVRQCLAATIVFCGLPYIKQRDFKKYLIIVFIAFLFHRTAVIMIAPYFVIGGKISYKKVFFLIGITCLTLLFYDRLIDFSEFILQDTIEKDGEYATRFVNIYRILVAVVPAVFYIIVYSGRDINESTSLNIQILIIHAVVMVMASRSALLARVGIYTSPFCALAIPELNKIFGRKTRFLVNSIILILYGIFFIYEVSNSSALNNFTWVFNYINY